MDYSNYYFQSGGILLRPWEPSDYEASFEMEYDSTCMSLVQEEVTLPGKHVTMDLNRDAAEIDEKAPAFSIVNQQGEYLGHIHFNYINERHGTFSLAILLKESERGKGYGKSAMRLLLDYAFEERRLHKFEGFCYDENLPSKKMMESLGCIQEGISRESIFMHGRYHDRLLYGMTEQEYREKYSK